MKALMVQGCTSSAGKSLLATVLCRHFARLGVRVAPFKGQNMSNHARVGDGGEMGAAQYFQALAAGVDARRAHEPRAGQAGGRATTARSWCSDRRRRS